MYFSLINIQKDSLDGGSARINISAYKGKADKSGHLCPRQCSKHRPQCLDDPKTTQTFRSVIDIFLNNI